MPENDFEKQVQQKMDELQFVPSDAVWPEVERQIEQRKKRRGVFFWLPFGVALLLGGAAWIYFSGIENAATKKETADNVIAKASAGNKNKNVDPSAATNDTTNAIKQAEILKDNASTHSKESTVVDDANGINKNETTTVKKSVSIKDQKNKSSITSSIETVSGNAQEKIAGQKYKAFRKTYKPNPVANKTGTKAKSIAAINTNEEATAAAASATEEKNNNAVAKASEKKDDVVSTEPATDSITEKEPLIVKNTLNDSLKHANKTDSSKAVAKTKPTTNAKKKIEWGINAGAGLSSLSDGFSGLFSSARSYDLAAFSGNQQSAPGNINGGGLSAAVTKPSEIKPGLSYAAGMFVNIPLDKKFNFLTGINYTYYSNSLKVGAKSDSTGRVYYVLGDLNNYTNRFHFIEIPVTVQLHTARFAINGGLSFSMLAGTNALLYNAQGKYYYSDKSLINKVQVGLLAGFSYRLFPKTMPIEIGPQINYNLTSIFNKDLYGGQHLFFGGINAKFYLHKK